MPERTCACGAPIVEPRDRKGPPRRFCCSCRPSRPRVASRTDRPDSVLRVTCKTCGVELTGSQRAYCSERCGNVSRGDCTYAAHPDRVCPTCGKTFAPTHWNQRYCPPTEDDRARKAKVISRCARQAAQTSYRSQLEAATCAHCDATFERVRGRATHVYCSDECHREAKRGRRKPLTHRVTFPPNDGHRDLANYRRAVRADPCAYCGERPANGVDHIEPTLKTGDRNDWTNWTACCKRCNETKRTLPLLLALPWIPVSRQYHDERRALFAA